ncbi:MAG TPA: hypothetical protein VG897_02600 [Terriglobales bacterium]|nr:hypothetical protein [Terriglobales bacterium]
MRINSGLLIILVCLTFPLISAAQTRGGYAPGSRTLMDAHNCYPYFEWWADRIDRALSAGTPLAIEQDLAWYTDPKSKKSWSVVSHGSPVTGHEPTIEQYFFTRIRPIVEKALHDGNQGDWPLITLNLDFKSEEPEHLATIWSLIQQHREWLTSAVKTSDESEVQPLDVRPVLILTGDSDRQKKTFYDEVPVGERLFIFGAVHTNERDPMAAPEVLEPNPATNYRRWWNNSWHVVERGGQPAAGDWTSDDNARLRALVTHAHAKGLWIRFYTLDGAEHPELSCHGWFSSYNFGSLASAKLRWAAAAKAGVDYVASDQYEELAKYLQPEHSLSKSTNHNGWTVAEKRK